MSNHSPLSTEATAEQRPRARSFGDPRAALAEPIRSFWTSDGQWIGNRQTTADRYERPDVQGIAELVESLRPEWIGTLTYDPKRSPHLSYDAAWRNLRRWCNQERRIIGRQLQWFGVVAPQQSGRPHHHVVFVNYGSASYVNASKRWQKRYGYAQLDRYKRERGGQLYLGLNYVLTQRGHTELNCSRGLHKFDRREPGASQAAERFRKVFDVVLE